MKVMHVGQMIGGLDIYIRNVVIYATGDIQFVIVHGEDDKNKVVIRDGKPIKEYLIPMYRALNPLKDMACLIKLLIIIRKEKPDIIHCHSAKGGVIGRLAGFLTSTKTFYTPHAFSFLSTPSPMKRMIYLWIERMMKLNSYLLACSESEKLLGMQVVHYSSERAYAWNNAVPDAAKILEK